jgi:hypothetical protein
MTLEAFRATLAGLRGVNLQIAPMNADAEQDGLTPADLRAEVESRLREAGIRVFTQAELLSEAPGMPFLHLDVSTLRLDAFYAYAIRLELWQAVRLTRDPTIQCLAVTWSTTGVLGTVRATSLSDARDAVRPVVDEFVSDYLAANPTP